MDKSHKRKYIFIISASLIVLIFFMVVFNVSNIQAILSQRIGEDSSASNDYSIFAQKLQNGDLSILANEDVDTNKLIDGYYKTETKNDNIEWVLQDINGDDVDEIIWQEKKSYREDIKRIVGVFAFQADAVKCVFWDANDSTEFFFLSSSGNIIYYIWDSGIYTSEGYYKCEIDEAYKWNMISGICIYNIYDLSELAPEMWNGDLPDRTGIYYSKYIPEPDKTLPGHMENISREEFLEIFLQMTGDEFADSEHIFE